MNKIISLVLCVAVIFSIVVSTGARPEGFLKLFGGYDGGGYNYNGYYQRPRYNRGRSYNDGEGGGRRYKAICRVHAVDSLAFPGKIGNPVCPY